jgi:hypothetical protein
MRLLKIAVAVVARLLLLFFGLSTLFYVISAVE